MLKQIQIDNFRCFDEFFVDFGQVTLLVGPNKSGKTTVLSAIRFVLTLLNVSVKNENEFFFSELDNFISFYRTIPFHNDLLWFPCNTIQSLFFKYTEETFFEIFLKYDTGKIIEEIHYYTDAAANSDIHITGQTLHEFIKPTNRDAWKWALRGQKEFAQLIPHAIFVPPFYGIILQEEYRSNQTLERLLSNGEHSQVIRNLVVRLDQEGEKRLNKFLEKTVAQKIIRMSPKAQFHDIEFLEVWLNDGAKEIELADAAAGVIALISLFAGLWRYRKDSKQGRQTIVLLDEPEAHLHPKLQGDVGVYLAELAIELNVQLIISTHSVEMINRMAHLPGVSILSIDKEANRATSLESETELLGELSRWCTLSPFSSLNLLRTKKILFHEGPADADILKRCAKIYFANRSDALQRFDDWTFALLEGVDNAEAKNILKRALAPVLLTQDSDDLAYIIRILDKDYTRQPQFEVKQDHKNRFETLDVVWSRHSIESLFLDNPCLLAFLSLYLKDVIQENVEGLSEAILSEHIQQAVEEINHDTELNENARIERTLKLKGKSFSDKEFKEAMKLAAMEINTAPAIWQKGKDRGRAILAAVRDKLPSRYQNRIRRDVVKMVTDCPITTSTISIESLIPEEIRKVLDYMVLV